MAADLILAGGRIYTLGRTGLRPHTHLAIGAGRVLAVGGAEVMDLRGRSTRVRDLDGGAVLPGFNDAHAHVVYYGLTSFGADLTGAHSVAEIQIRLRRAAARLQPGQWLIGRGYIPVELAERRPPHRLEIDAAVGGMPAYIDERGGHGRVANSAALAAAGVTPATPDPAGGALGRDPDGTPDGSLLESAMRLVADHQPPPGLAMRRQGVLRCQRLLSSRGITSVGAAVNRGFADDLKAYEQLADSGRLRIRVNEFLSWELLEAASALGIRAGFGGPLVRAGPIKVFVDGAGAGSVVRRDIEGGTWRTLPGELRELVARASRAGLQMASHAIGDGAIEAMLDAVEAAGAAGKRHRIEHCTVCPPDLQARAGRLGVVAVMQPLAAARRKWAGETFAGGQAADIAPHRGLMRSGVVLAFSSDLPVATDPNPWDGVAAAVTDELQGLSPLAALRAYTVGGAYSSFEENLKGTLEPARLADLQVYDADPLRLPATEWPRLRPHLVLLGGNPVVGAL
jgi:predicted amidohydrolase YtcJ